MTWIRFVLILYFFMVAHKAASQTLSKAFLKSMKAWWRPCWCSRYVSQMILSLKICSVVLLTPLSLLVLQWWSSLLVASICSVWSSKLQKVQNSAARLVLSADKRDHVSPLLITLHWLPIQARIQYISCQHSVTTFSLIQPLFICLTFSVSTLYQDSSAPHLTQELYAFRT